MRRAQYRCAADGGYAMAALLVALALMAVFMTVAMPVWRQAAQREKEEELVWRGQQFDRAIQLFRRKFSVPGPPNLDILVQQKFLRKKYKDPITGGDFELKALGPGGVNLPPGVPQPPRAEGQLIGGVRSKSKDKSIRVLNGRDRYNEWEFVYVPYNPNGQPAGPGGPASSQQPGGRGPTPGGSSVRPVPQPPSGEEP